MLAIEPALGEPVELAAQDLPRRRRHRPAVLPLDVADDERRLLEPRDAPERRHVGVEDEVAVAGLPRGHLEPLHRHHVDVDGEQVVAALRAVRRDLVAEEGRVEALALEPSLHVGHDEQDGVDLAALNVARSSSEAGQRHAPFIYCWRDGPQAAGDRDQRLRRARRLRAVEGHALRARARGVHPVGAAAGGVPVLIPPTEVAPRSSRRRRDGLHRRLRHRTLRLRRRSRTRSRAGSRPTATRPSSSSCARRSTGGCRCSASAAACSS